MIIYKLADNYYFQIFILRVCSYFFPDALKHKENVFKHEECFL